MTPHAPAPHRPFPPCPDGPAAADRLRAILSAIPVGVRVDDSEGRTVLANPAALRLADANERIVEHTVVDLVHAGEPLRLTTLFDVTAEREVARELFDRAYLDELTGLPNRSLLDQSLTQLVEDADDRAFALAFIDLDNFKHINDFYSHAAGDALLVKVSARLSSLLRETDILARIGGDEFVLILSPADDAAELAERLDTFSRRLKDPFFIDGHEIFASASIGVSVFPLHGADCDTLKRNADCAMYRAKGGRKGTVVVYDDSMSHAAATRSLQEQRFRLAIRDKRFTCAFQPKVEMRTGQVHGVEMLMRWRDEQGSIQPPGAFVGLAIELGLINEITFLMVAEVVDSLDHIDAAFGTGVTISLNVAARQATDPSFMMELCAMLAASGVPGRFMVEITEEAFLEKDLFQKTILPRLREIGVKVSIDDFGVGYSSLAALADLTADEVKIDRAFVTDIHKRPRSQSILKAIESLAGALDMAVIAEGVETYEEVLWLQSCTGIRSAQGYYFSKPVALADLAERRPASDFAIGSSVASERSAVTRPAARSRG